MELYSVSNPIAETYVIDVDKGCIEYTSNQTIQQGEHDSRFIQARLVKNGTPVDLSHCEVYFLTFLPGIQDKPTMTKCNIFNEQQGEVNVLVKNYMSEFVGKLECEFLRVGIDGTALPFKKFNLSVDGSIYTSDTIESSEPLHALVEAIATVQRYEQEMGGILEDLTDKKNHFDEFEGKVNEVEKRADVLDHSISIIEGSAKEIEHQRTDYMGNAHQTMKDASDANVEYLIGEMNTAHYEGQSITATDTIEKQVRSAILRGQTLVNIAPIYYGAANVKLSDEVTIKANVENAVANYRVKWFRPIHSLKPNTKYLIKFDITELNNIVGLSSYLKYDTGEYTYGIFQGLTSVGRYSIPFTTDSRNCTEIAIYTQKSDDETIYAKIKGVMVFEYVEGMETWDIPYFTGMQSVRMPVQTSVGKNLFDGEYELDKYLSADGALLTSKNWATTKNYIKVKPNTTYTQNISMPNSIVYVVFYNRDKKIIGSQVGNNVTINKIATYTTPNECYFMKTCYNYSLVGNQLFQIEEGTQSTAYEPHKSNILSISEEVVLRSLPNGVCDTLNLITGEYVQRIEEITITDNIIGASYSMSKQMDNEGNYLTIEPAFSKKVKGLGGLTGEAYCDKFINGNPYSTTVNCVGVYNRQARIYYNNATDVQTYKDMLKSNPVKVQYELDTPIIKTVDLNNQKVYSYDGTTHYTCSSEDGSLVPTLSIDVPTNLPALVSRQRETIQTLSAENETLKEDVVIVNQQREDGDVELLGYNFDLDFRLLEIECALDLPIALNFRNSKGANDMNTYKTAKTLILAGNYEREDMEYKLSVYLKRGRLTQEEHDELIALMDARELVA